ncbi:hypothetical protein HYFRA_00000786 [Hymenoscyphus fraxineus]|uniref:Uncharacterized protein n=1 Tax=Hymenoscyphus fraxineus TaxID=746836 RepID=A0A9N9KTW7_9HELO|nr:hypothetical protein HYFRA_00000786 [Hymenoscyphus fraxineus]
MSTAVAMAPSPAPHDRSSYVDIVPSGPSSKSPPAQRVSASATPNLSAQRTGSGSPKSTPASASKGSPTALRNGVPPKIIVKKEPSSPDLPTSRHRPRKLDLSKNTSSANPASRPSAGQLTSRGAHTGGLEIHDVGLACLSPGFVTQDPTMREQLQRSISVREQQRQLIEARLQQTAKPENAPTESAKERDFGGFGTKTPGTSKRKAPPGLSIVAPSHEQFAHERVIQSAPLNQSFTGRHQPHPLTRHIANQPSNLSNTSHIHHVPATQTANRLPPITDVFAENGLGAHRDPSGPVRTSVVQNNNGSASNSSHSNSRPAFPSPGHNSTQPPHSARPREYRSAEEAQVELAGGRTELLPKLVHYGGHQPPTPPSPLPGNHMRQAETSRSGGGRRRQRAEYEEGASPPLGNGPATSRRTGPFGEGRDSPSTQHKKKMEFMQLCDRAWDLFHS